MLDAKGGVVRTLHATARRGINRVVWDLRHEPFETGMQGESGRRGRALDGPFVEPGEYVVRLEAAGETVEQKVQVEDDPRIDVAPAVRHAWVGTLMTLGALYQSADALLARARTAAGAIIKSGTASGARQAEAEATLDAAVELRSRVAVLYAALEGHVGPPTADQRTQLEYYPKALSDIDARVKRLEIPSPR